VRIGAVLAAWGRPRVADIGLALKGTSQHALKTYYLSSMDVFRDLPRSEVERLAETTRMITCPRGKVVYRAGESNEALFLLKTGRVQIVRESADGKRLISAVLGPHTFFGEMALVGQRFPQDSTAEAVEEALICVLSRKDLERLVLQHPKVGLRFPEQVSARLLETEAVVEDFAFKSVPARLAGALLRLVETSQSQTVHASHQELADMIAAYRETVTIALDELQAHGLVKLSRRSIEILDQPALEKLAAG
jgi:CRP/FNR family transcriptional regulator, cyclic AMP receptor protein